MTCCLKCVVDLEVTLSPEEVDSACPSLACDVAACLAGRRCRVVFVPRCAFFLCVSFVRSSVFVVLISADDTWKHFYAKNTTECIFKQGLGSVWNIEMSSSFFVVQKYFMMQ